MKEGTPNLDASHWFHVDLGDLLWNGSFLPDANISSHRFTQSHQVLLFTVRETRFSLTFSFAIFVYCSQVLSLESFRTFVKFSQISWSSYFFYLSLLFFTSHRFTFWTPKGIGISSSTCSGHSTRRQSHSCASTKQWIMEAWTAPRFAHDPFMLLIVAYCFLSLLQVWVGQHEWCLIRMKCDSTMELAGRFARSFHSSNSLQQIENAGC